ncbi:MAG: OmpA family [Actinomycetota bacterium]
MNRLNTSSMKSAFKRHLRTAVAATVVLSIAPFAIRSASATEAGPNGANVGFDFTWDDIANPLGTSASFLETDGTTANNCSGSGLTATTKTCNFVFDYRVNGALQASTTHAARWITWTNPTSYTNGKPVATGCSSPTSGAGNLGKAPLTLFDCFNTSSFGQVIHAKVSGPITQARFALTCLTPSGTAPYELYALLYELSADGTTLVSPSPLGANLVNLSKCPTSSTWRGKTFKSTDFAMTSMTFNNASLTAGKFYGIYFTGNGVPGALPPGAAAAMAAAKAATTTTTVPKTTTTTTPWSAFKGESNKTASGTTAVVNTAFTALDSVSINRSAIRMMTPDQAKKYVINPLTPKVCLGAGRNLVLIHTGRCTAQIALRANGRVSSTVTTKVISGTVTASDTIVAIAEPTIAYFVGGDSRVKDSSRKDIFSLAASAKNSDAVLVTGHSGNLAGEQANLVTLSSKRAASVRALLRGKGVTKTIAIWSFGASLPVTNSKSDKDQNLNRRAEIYLIP